MPRPPRELLKPPRIQGPHHSQARSVPRCLNIGRNGAGAEGCGPGRVWPLAGSDVTATGKGGAVACVYG